MASPSCGSTTRRHSRAAARTPEMKALHADGAKFIGRIKSYVVEEKFVIGS